MPPDGKPYGLKDQIYRQHGAGSPLPGGRLIEAVGDDGSRLMIEAAQALSKGGTEPGLPRCRFFIFDYYEEK